MNEDMERRLRGLFEDKAAESGVAPRAPEAVMRRSRRRQMGTVAVSLVTVFALAGVSFAGLRALNGEASRQRLPADVSPYDSGRYPIFEQTARIESFDVTSPSDWYLVNQWPLGAQLATTSASACASASPVGPPVDDPQDVAPGGSGEPDVISETCGSASPEVALGALPVLQLSNRDLGLDMPACGLGGTPPMTMTGDDAVMAVAIDYEAILAPGSDSVTGQGEVLTIDGAGAPDDDLCGAGYYRKFVWRGVPYVAWASFGPDVTAEDRSVALNAITLIGNGFIGSSTAQGSAYILAAGENAAGPWTLELRPSTSDGPDANIQLSLVSAEGGPSAADFRVPEEHEIEQAGGDPVFGVVTKSAARVVLRQESALSPIAATLIPLPPSLPFAFDVFLASNEADVPAEAIALGIDGSSLSSEPPATPTQSAPTEGLRTISEGETLGSSWSLHLGDTPGRFRILLLDADEDVLARITPEQFNELHSSLLEYSSFTFSQGDSQAVVVFGATAPSADQLAIGLDIGVTGNLRDGDPRWDPLPVLTSSGLPSLHLWWFEVASGHGQLATFTDTCTRIAHLRLDTDSAVPGLPTPPPTVELTCDDRRFKDPAI